MSTWAADADSRDAIVSRPAQLVSELVGQPLQADQVSSLFQPIVELDGSSVLGYEALTRGPRGSRLESPAALFGAMRDDGRLAEFDRACRDAALVRAQQAGIDPPLTVFVNVEPALVEAPWSEPEHEPWIAAPHDLRCVIEITERALTDRPAELLHAVARVRDAAWGLALDDVGADPRSLALMPLLRPDIIKLDLRLVQQRPDRALAEVVAAVNAYAGESGALVLAEGIETDEHLQIALALGARLGQGWRFGRPEPARDIVAQAGPPIPFLGADHHRHGPTPYDLVRERQPMRRGNESLLRAINERLELLALQLGPATVVLAGQSDERLQRHGCDGLAALTAHAALVGVAGIQHRDDLPFRGGSPDPDLAHEWSLAVVSPHFCAALVAREIGPGHDDEPVYDFALTHDHRLVAACARSLAARLAPIA